MDESCHGLVSLKQILTKARGAMLASNVPAPQGWGWSAGICGLPFSCWECVTGKNTVVFHQVRAALTSVDRYAFDASNVNISSAILLCHHRPRLSVQLKTSRGLSTHHSSLPMVKHVAARRSEPEEAWTGEKINGGHQKLDRINLCESRRSCKK